MATIDIKSDHRTAEAVRKAICKNIYRSEDMYKLSDAKRELMLKDPDIADYKAYQFKGKMIKAMYKR